MSRADVDAFLAEADDVIADWEGSADAASWSADGSHEHDTGGEYYGADRFGMSLLDSGMAAVERSIARGLAAHAGRTAFLPGGMIVGPSREALEALVRPTPLEAVGIADAPEGGTVTEYRMDSPDPVARLLQLSEGDTVSLDLGGDPQRVTVASVHQDDDGTIRLTLTPERAHLDAPSCRLCGEPGGDCPYVCC